MSEHDQGREQDQDALEETAEERDQETQEGQIRPRANPLGSATPDEPTGKSYEERDRAEGGRA